MTNQNKQFSKSYHYMLQVELKGVEKKHKTFFNVRTTWLKNRQVYGGAIILLPPCESQGGLPGPPTGINRERLKSGVAGKIMQKESRGWQKKFCASRDNCKV